LTTPNDLGLLVDAWREGQFDVIARSLSSARRFSAHCVPTGGGKSISLVGAALASGGRALILTESKELQKQYAEQFKYLDILDIRGKSNYRCKAMDVGGEFYDGTPAKSVAEGPCHFGDECSLRLRGCTYYDKINAAKYKKLVVTNYAAWISANMFTEGWGQFDIICADECHTMEQWLTRMLAVKFPRCYGNLTTSKMPTNTNIAMWVHWANRELPLIRAAVRLEKREIARGKRKKLVKLRTLQSVESHLSRLRMMSSEWRVFPEKQHILFQPIWVHEYAEPLLFTNAAKVICASSTMVPNTLRLLGILDQDMDFYNYPSTFPIERRPIYYYPVIKMKYGMSEDEERQWVKEVDDFISQRLDRKGIIHTVSYARTELLLKYSRYANLMIASSSAASSASTLTLQRFKAAPDPAILVGPNWMTGIDLPGTLAEYTIIPKIPFADITDPLHKARSEDNPDYGWYDAGLKLVQSIGRAMRSKDDRNECLITDKAFGAYLGQHKNMLPDWIRSAVVRVTELPTPAERL